MATIESLEAKLWLNKEKQESFEKQKTLDTTKKSLKELKQEILKDEPEEVLERNYDTEEGRELIIEYIISWEITAEIFHGRYIEFTGKNIPKNEINSIFNNINGTNVQKQEEAKKQLIKIMKKIEPAL